MKPLIKLRNFEEENPNLLGKRIGNFEKLKRKPKILLINPIPFVEKVFSLLIQDEKQRLVGQGSNNGPFVESIALAVKTMNLDSKTFKKAKEKPTCNHCGLCGHTMEKCYKLHSYPSGYKTKPRANQVFSFNGAQDSVTVTT